MPGRGNRLLLTTWNTNLGEYFQIARVCAAYLPRWNTNSAASNLEFAALVRIGEGSGRELNRRRR
jgi:hypothetical protein